VQVQSAPNDWHYTVGPNAALSAIDDVAVASASTPLGWPICWLALALGTLALCLRLPSRRLILPLVLSALLYGFGYVVLSVAAEERYYLWTMIAALLATVLVAGDLVAAGEIRSRRVLLGVTPVVIVAMLCIAARIG
jgi:hypothetical protein